MRWKEVPAPRFLWPRVRELLNNLRWNASGTKSRADEIALSVFDPEEPYVYVSRVARLRFELDWAFFLLAFNAVESWLVERAYGSPTARKSAADALARIAERSGISAWLSDDEDMHRRLADLQALRNEVTHRSGEWQPSPLSAAAMKRLEQAGEIAQVDDPEEHVRNLIEVKSIAILLRDLDQIVIVCSANPDRQTDS